MNLPLFSRPFRCWFSLRSLALLLLAWWGAGMAGGVARGAADFVVRTPDSSTFTYTINGTGGTPPLTLVRGRTYTFDVVTCSCHPFQIVDANDNPLAGVTNNNTNSGTVIFQVPLTAVNYAYRCSVHTFITNTITTTPPPAATATLAATGITATVATLNGSVNPNGSSTTASFTYGTDPALAADTTTTDGQALGSGTAVVPFNAAVGPLAPATTYYFQAAATSGNGTTLGSILSFATPSNVSSLASLTLSPGGLDQAFTPGNGQYTSRVDNSVTSVQVAAGLTEPHATVTVSGSTPTLGGATVPLAVGLNTIPVVVTAQDGTTSTTYTLSVRRSAPTTLDPTFGTGGRATLVAGSAGTVLSQSGRAIVVQPDGKAVIAGTATYSGKVRFVVARFNTDGSADTTFNGTGNVSTAFGSANVVAQGVALQKDGKIVVAGHTGQTPQDGQDYAVARYNTDGSLDGSFGTGGLVTTDLGGLDAAYGLVIQPDGKIVVAGTQTAPSRVGLVRYNTDGTLDSTFGTGGIVIQASTSGGSATAYAVALQRDGRLIVSGGTGGGFTLFRFKTDGTLDATFGTSGMTLISGTTTSYAVAVQADDKIIAGGQTSATGVSAANVGLVRLLPDGARDTSFGSNGRAATPPLGNSDQCTGIALQPDGRIVAVGYSSISSTNTATVYRFTTEGTLDPTLNGTGIDSADSQAIAYGVAIARDGGILTTGASTYPSGFRIAVDRFAGGVAYVPYAWGNDADGEVGDLASGMGMQRSLPTPVSLTGALAGKRVASIAVGGSHTVALCTDGTVACWGTNFDGELGNNSTTPSTLPVAVDVSASSALSGKTVVAVAAGPYFSLALCSDGTVAGWGTTGYGQLGTTGQSDCLIPTAMDADAPSALNGKKVIAIAAGNQFSLMLCADGTVAGCGFNFGGQLGDGTSTNHWLYPVAVSTAADSALNGKTVVSIAAGLYHGLALCADGTLAAWGTNSHGQLGDGTTTPQITPVLVNVLSGVLQNKRVCAVAAGGLHSLALCTDGTLAAWGYNEHGELGTGTPGTDPVTTPVAVDASGVLAGGKRVTSITGSGNQSYALCNDGSLAAWGENGLGTLGNGSTTDSALPVLVDVSPLAAAAGRPISVAGSAAAFHTAMIAAVLSVPQIQVTAQSGKEYSNNGAPFVFNETAMHTVSINGHSLQGFTLTVRNTGLASLNSLSLSLASGDNAAEFAFDTTNLPGTLAPGASGTFDIGFTAGGPGLRSAVLQIASNDASHNPFLLNLNGFSDTSDPRLASLTTNAGALSPVLDGTTFDDAVTAFTVDAGTSPSITFTPTALVASATITVNGVAVVSGTASAAVALDGGSNVIPIVVTAHDGVTTQSYTVTVMRDAPGLGVDQPPGTHLARGTTVDFGVTSTGTTGLTKTFALVNTGTEMLQSIQATLGGTNSADFVLTPPASSTLAPAATASFSIVFHPLTAGRKTATLTVASSDDLPAYTITVTGGTHGVSLGVTSQTVREDPQTINVPVRLSAPLNTAFSVAFTLGGSAVNLTNYTHTASPLAFKANQTVANITLTLKDNLTPEPDKTLTIDLASATNGVTVVSPSHYLLTILDDDTPPTITAPVPPVPTNQIVAVGDPVAFSYHVAGSPPLTMAWKKGKVIIPGATTGTLNLTAAAVLTDGAAYTLSATNTRTTVATTVQLAVVDPASSILRYDLAKTAVLTVNTGGTITSYQWRNPMGNPISNGDGKKYAGATGKTLNIKGLTALDAGIYTCLVTAPGGGITSGNFTVEVATAKPSPQPLAFPDCVVNNPYHYQIPYDDTSALAPIKFVCGSLPKGLACNAATGVISGTPTVVGSPLVTVTISNGLGPVAATPANLNVLPYPPGAQGSYVALLQRDVTVNNGLGGRLDWTTASTGGFSGTLHLGTTPYALKGVMTTANTLNAHPQYTATIVRKGLPSLVLAVDLDPQADTLSGSLHLVGNPALTNLSGWRNTWHAAALGVVSNLATTFTGSHSFAILPVSGDPALPQGYGYGTVTTTNLGVTTVTGRTGDGNVLSTAGLLSPSGQVVFYQSLYANLGSVMGLVGISSGGTQTLGDVSLDWQKNGGVARDYKPFGPAPLHITGGLYVNGGPVLGLTPVLPPPNTDSNAQLDFDSSGLIDSLVNPSVTLRLSTANVATLPATTALVNRGKITALKIITSATGGTFSGTFTLPEPAPKGRTVSFQGQLVTPDNLGYGYFLLPQQANPSALPPTTATTSPILSGKVTLQQPGN